MPDMDTGFSLHTRSRDSLCVACLQAVTIATLLGLALVLTGCVSNKYKAASALGAQPQRMDIDLGGAPELKTQLDAVIIYQGPGTWKKAAYWDEIMVSLVNKSGQSINLTSANLVDFAGGRVLAGTDPWELEKASQAQRDRYTNAGVSFALNTLGYAALTYGAVGAGAIAGAAVSSTWGGMASGAMAGVALVPVTAIAVYANNQKHKHEIEREFNRRRLALPLTLQPGQAVSGSLFFPMTVSPQSLRLEWIKGSEHGGVTLPLPMLAGMHLKQPAK